MHRVGARNAHRARNEDRTARRGIRRIENSRRVRRSGSTGRVRKVCSRYGQIAKTLRDGQHGAEIHKDVALANDGTGDRDVGVRSSLRKTMAWGSNAEEGAGPRSGIGIAWSDEDPVRPLLLGQTGRGTRQSRLRA
ncbi:unnamed protein product [Chondrus crispus]|uniref:Uncharacterized protein n=1 Tax=Chondrus crispus TaxID=2769 RepID=R7QK06_CHOCR|nr:unnamed protein product [Chondrus crispus]CDF38414.1 unnamed protein product [Chondrus crispus]|eukprot:XP_005718307.1 unnamed protein product [Chondrus crispus]